MSTVHDFAADIILIAKESDFEFHLRTVVLALVLIFQSAIVVPFVVNRIKEDLMAKHTKHDVELLNVWNIILKICM
jgi:hypothetical protein